MRKSVIASSRDWFAIHPKSDDFKNLDLIEITNRNDLNLENLRKIDPRYIFFPHWSWRVGPEIFEEFECVVFHTAPLPYGRGGSPIQNLIIRGFNQAPVCAIRMTGVLDGGPIYCSQDVSLSGTIDEIFSEIAKCVEVLILKICKFNPSPVHQEGDAVLFKRLTYEDNILRQEHSIDELYDRIRMVDGAGYKPAYIIFGDYKIEFSGAKLMRDELCANIRIFRNSD